MGLIRSFLEANHEVHAIAPPDEYSQRLIDARCQYHPVDLDNKGSNPAKDLHYLYKLYHLYKRINPDVVLHFTIKPNLYGTAAARLLNIPTINNVSGLGTVFLRKSVTSKVAQYLYRFMFRFPQKVFFQNADDQQFFINQKLVTREITEVLPGSGVNVTKFFPAAFKKNQVFTFLLVARLLRDKGIVEYAEAIKLLKDQGVQAKFQLVGFKDTSPYGITEVELQHWLDTQLLHYLGTTDNIQEIMQEADCVVLPSYREGTPRTLLEAASLAKPLIATRVPGCVEVVENGVNGFLCEAKNAGDLAIQMQKMLSLDVETLKQMGSASRNKAVTRFDENIVIERYKHAIQEVTRKK